MDWLTREQIDAVLAELSADDLITAADAAGVGSSGRAAISFNAAADRVLGSAGEGQKWTQRIRATDFKYFADQISEAVNLDSPLSEGTSDLLDSLEPGEAESDPQT